MVWSPSKKQKNGWQSCWMNFRRPSSKSSTAASACSPMQSRDPDFPGEDLYILGEYCQDPYLGRSIVIYYGSFEPVFGDLSPLELRRELRDTLRHEFRHHVEALAGENGLDLEDEAWLAEYLEESRPVRDPEKAAQKAYEKGLADGKRSKWWNRRKKE